tara:strand:+ start:610 stop:816 length:207 start_codon:yes stop_codon:yes gene_type:complete
MDSENAGKATFLEKLVLGTTFLAMLGVMTLNLLPNYTPYKSSEYLRKPATSEIIRESSDIPYFGRYDK